jgi:hypothetical protein
MNEQDQLDFAREMQQHLLEWECDGRYIVVYGFPEGATVLPDDFHDVLVDQYVFPSGSSGIAWTKKTGWVGVATCGQGPVVWYVQNENTKVTTPDQRMKDLASEIREKFKGC